MRAAIPALALLVAAAPVAARADEAHDLAGDIASLTGADAAFEMMMRVMRDQVVVVMGAKSHKSTAELDQIFDELVLPSVPKCLPRMRAAFAEIYVENFDVADLRGIDGFYRSPVGRHMLARQSQIAAQVIQATIPIISDEMQQAIRAHADQLRQRGVSL